MRIVWLTSMNEKTVSLEKLGDVTYHFLKVKNLSETVEVRYRVVFTFAHKKNRPYN